MSYHIKVQLLQEDIDTHQSLKATYEAWADRFMDHKRRGFPGDDFQEAPPKYDVCRCCPFANALRRILGRPITVTNRSWWPTEEGPDTPHYPLPQEAKLWIGNYDTNEKPALSEFDFEIPAHLMPVGSL